MHPSTPHQRTGAYTHIQTRTRTQARRHARTHAHTHTHTHTRTHTHTHTRTHPHTHKRTHTHTHTHTHTPPTPTPSTASLAPDLKINKNVDRLIQFRIHTSLCSLTLRRSQCMLILMVCSLGHDLSCCCVDCGLTGEYGQFTAQHSAPASGPRSV